MHRIPAIVLLTALAVSASAAPMARVTEIRNGRTLVVDGNTEVRLAGIEITNDLGARELLRWTVGNSWVLVEASADGAAMVYRSPDGMCINRELVLRGYARATAPGIEPERIAATYLGIVNPGPRGAASVSEKAPRTRSGTSARSQAPRAPRSSKPPARRRPR